MMRLKTTSTTVTFRREFNFPAGAFHIEVEARPMGKVNPGYMAAQEVAAFNYQIEMDPEARAVAAARLTLGEALLAAKAAPDKQPAVDEAMRLLQAASAKQSTESKRHMAKAEQAFGEAIAAAIYDECVVSWATNLEDRETGPVTADRDTFIALHGIALPEMKAAMMDLQTALLEAGAKVLAETEAAIKN